MTVTEAMVVDVIAMTMLLVTDTVMTEAMAATVVGVKNAEEVSYHRCRSHYTTNNF